MLRLDKITFFSGMKPTLCGSNEVSYHISSGSVAALIALVYSALGAHSSISGNHIPGNIFPGLFSHQNLAPLNIHLLKAHKEYNYVRIIFIMAWFSSILCTIDRYLNSGIEHATAKLWYHKISTNRFATISSTG